MRVLALDTTTRAGSVALVDDDRVIAERRGDPRARTRERLPGDILRLVRSAGVSLACRVDVFAVASGPGSFTGLRIGIATMQGLAFVHRRPIVAVSALEALAQIASRGLSPGSIVAAWMDAHRREVFSALYRVADAPPFVAGAPESRSTRPRSASPGSALSRWASGRIVRGEPCSSATAQRCTPTSFVTTARKRSDAAASAGRSDRLDGRRRAPGGARPSIRPACSRCMSGGPMRRLNVSEEHRPADA